MGYDQEFYSRYEKYLLDPVVRKAHDRAFRFFQNFASTPKVVDLGCGQSQEFRKYGFWESYVGFDVNAIETEDPSGPLVGNYRDPEFITSLKEKPFTAFVSLFSTEITARADKNTLLYQNLFSQIKTLEWGLVSGFYYASMRSLNPIREDGDLVSWQTLQNLDEHLVPDYEEYRFYTSVPSELFGWDVIEVWRMFQRR